MCVDAHRVLLLAVVFAFLVPDLEGAGASAAGVAPALADLPLADCGIAEKASALWHASSELDAGAERWASGSALGDAVARGGYTATALSGLRVYGLDSADRPRLNASSCRILRDRSLNEVGAFRRGDELWVVFAARVTLPNAESGEQTARRALILVNAAREQGHLCGDRSWARANAVQLSAILTAVARAHALDMARNHYFDHVDQSGRSPADRVKAAGYREQRVAENIAYGTLSTEEVIAGWLKSPGHCENLMEPRFKEMGIAYAQGSGTHRELYWVQLLADPR